MGAAIKHLFLVLAGTSATTTSAKSSFHLPTSFISSGLKAAQESSHQVWQSRNSIHVGEGAPTSRTQLSASSSSLPQWNEIEKALQPSYGMTPSTTAIDSALDPSSPNYSTERPTIFRERHGWCPYSERVWLALEHRNIEHDTIRIDNTGPGRRPPYFAGQTPQMRWPEGSEQGESLDLVEALDERYPDAGSGLLYPSDMEDEIEEKIRSFRNIFPRARPSSRAAFLFSWSGEPLFKKEFERVLSETDELLGQTSVGGPFFCGGTFTAADVAWAPFLERYRAQLPCLHDGLNPYDADLYPHLTAWYDAMDTQVPAYACRVKGDSSSWRKVLMMAGFGNAGVTPTVVLKRMEEADAIERLPLSSDEEERQQALWDEYSSTRPFLASTPSAEAAAVMTRNRDAIVADILKLSSFTKEDIVPPQDEKELDEAMRGLACLLIGGGLGNAEDIKTIAGIGKLASFLDDRMCVPRDMGAMSAAAIKRLAYQLS